jgi:hypothetical protein
MEAVLLLLLLVTRANPFRNIAPCLRMCCPQHSVSLPRFPVSWCRLMVRGRCTLCQKWSSGFEFADRGVETIFWTSAVVEWNIITT